MITKSDLLSMLQCPRKLWLEHNRPELVRKADKTSWRRARDGQIVGEKARERLGSDVLWPAGGNAVAAAQAARELLAKSSSIPAVEFPMVSGDLYIRADALLPDGDAYVLQETKASTYPRDKDGLPGKPKSHYVDDLAIQSWVAQSAGMKVSRAELNLIDNRWHYPGNDDYRGLFRQLDITATVRERMEHVPAWMQQAKTILQGDLPAASVGSHCSKPYECAFADFCQSREPVPPEHPITLLPGLQGKRLASKLQASHGYSSILEPHEHELEGDEAALYRRIQRAHATGSAILESGCDRILNELPYPRYYFDFEAIDLPVPYWKGVRPYEHIPFQWSCHIERTPGILEHAQFLDVTGQDPSLGCIEKLLNAISPDDGGPIFVYYSTYEIGRLRELAERHPTHAAALEKCIERIVDLLPLVRAHYYHPAMHGSFSIKRVLPVIAPNLDYSALEDVQDGSSAQVAYLRAAFASDLSAVERSRLESNMKAYCRQDTWAMVEIANFLAGFPRPEQPQK